MQLFLKILIEMANSVDTDQTGLVLFAYVILSETLVYEILGHLPHVFLVVHGNTCKKSSVNGNRG